MPDLRALMILLVLLLTGTSAVLANPYVLLQRGGELLQQGQTEEALVVLHEAEKGLPDPTLANGMLGEAYLLLGMQHLNQGGAAAAREAFAEAKRYLPNDFRPWQGSAIAWLHDGQPAAASGELQEALALAGARSDLLLLLGRAHYAAGELEQAEAAWVQAAELGAGEETTPLLEKVRRELRAEQAMHRDLAGRFTLAYAPGVSDALAAQVLEVLQDAYAEVGANLGYYPEADIPVLLYAREDFAAVTRSPEWAGAVYDGKIRVPLGGVKSMNPPLRALLHHEYTHVVVRFLGNGRVPVWLNEGLAEVAGRRYFQSPHPAVKPSGQRLAATALERPFSELSTEQVPQAYEQSYARVQRLVELCGWPALGELLQRLGTGASMADAVSAAYAPCGYDWAQLQAELGLSGK